MKALIMSADNFEDSELLVPVGAQWELRGAVARRDQTHARGFFPQSRLVDGILAGP
jgi:hypothetical protein